MTSLHIDSQDGRQIVDLRRDRVTIGRAGDNDVVLADTSVSRHHAVLERAESRWSVRDLSSRNGTFVNGLRVTSSPIGTDDAIAIAGYRLQVVDSAPPSEIDGATERFRPPEGKDVLTARETEIVRLVAMGYTDAAIADALSISMKTVQSHLDRIRAKTGLRRRPDLTRLAVELRLLS